MPMGPHAQQAGGSRSQTWSQVYKKSMGLERNMKQKKEVESDGKGLFLFCFVFIGPSFTIITSMVVNVEIALPSDSHCITWSLKMAFNPLPALTLAS